MGVLLGVVEWVEAMLRARSRVYLVGACIVGALLLWMMLALVKSLWGLILLIAISAGLGYAAEHFYPARHPYGMLGSTLIGLFGATVGQRLFGTLGPEVAGVRLIPAFVGILLVNWALRSMSLASRARALDKYDAKGGQDPLLLSKLGHYRLVKCLGSGGSSRVYRAIPDRTLNEDEAIAIKVFNDEAINDAEFAGRLQREIDLLNKLNHPRIVKVYRSGEQDTLRYLEMEYVEGEPLSKRLEGGPLPLEEALEMTIELSRVLGYAHTLSVVHRDIKPDNIMLTKTGPRLLDFGLARPEGRSSLTQTGSALGTPSYMSPEQIRDDHDIDGRADQYALGCVLFELVTGQRPFQSESSVQVMMKHLNEPLQDPRRLNPKIPDLLARTIWHMMAKNRDDRFPTMQAVVPQLEQVLGQLKTPAKV